MRPGFSLSYPISPPGVGAAEALPPAAHSTRRSPVPYLFGGLAAMLCLISLALLILAFSYWKLSAYLGGSGSHRAEHDESVGGKAIEVSPVNPAMELEERVVVIMAGIEESIFLATPVSKNGKPEGGVRFQDGDQTHSEKS